jgi:hypothetical protein
LNCVVLSTTDSSVPSSYSSTCYLDSGLYRQWLLRLYSLFCLVEETYVSSDKCSSVGEAIVGWHVG